MFVFLTNHFFVVFLFFFFFKQKTAYEIYQCDWSSDVCSSDLTLIHEIVHSVHYIFREREIPLSEDTEEVAAYMIEYICNELLLI